MCASEPLATYRFSRNPRFRLFLPWWMYRYYLYLRFSNSQEAKAVISDHITSHVTHTAHRFVQWRRTPCYYRWKISPNSQLFTVIKISYYWGNDTETRETINTWWVYTEKRKRLISHVITSVVHQADRTFSEQPSTSDPQAVLPASWSPFVLPASQLWAGVKCDRDRAPRQMNAVPGIVTEKACARIHRM
jgi:hypothetical protein